MRAIRYDTTMFRQLLREKRHQTVVMWLLTLSVILPMIVFFNGGAGRRAERGPGGSAGVIFGRKIPWETFEQERRLVRRSLETSLGGGQALPQMFEPFVQQQAWDRLILRDEAKRRIRLSDDEVARYIQQQDVFRVNGRFDRQHYYRFLSGIGQTPQNFEEQIRDDLRIQKLIDRVKVDVAVTDEDVRSAYATDHEQLRTELLLVTPSDLEPQIRLTLSDDELRAYYASHPDTVRTPEKRTIEYVGWSQQELIAQAPAPSDDKLTAYLASHPDNFKQTDGTAPPLDAVRERVKHKVLEEHAAKQLKSFELDLQEDIDEGRTLEQISADRKRPIQRVGPVDRSSPPTPNGPTGSMVNEAFDVVIGRTTKVLSEPEGVFVLRPTDETPSTVPPFEQVHERVARLLTAERAKEAARDRATHLHDELATLQRQGLAFDKACAVVGVTPQRPSPFTHEGPQDVVGYASSTFAPLFDLPPGTMSDALDTPTGHVIAFVVEHVPYDPAAFEKDKATFRTTVLERKQRERIEAWLGSLRQSAHLQSFIETPPPGTNDLPRPGPQQVPSR